MIEEIKENNEKEKTINNIEKFIKEKEKELAQSTKINIVNNNKPNIRVANDSDESRIEKLRIFGRKNRNDLNNFIAFNDKVEMTPRERNFWEKRIKPLVKAFDESIAYFVDTIPVQEKEMLEIQQLLTDKQIKDIKVDFAEEGKFSVIQTTGELILIGNKEEIQCCLNGLYMAEKIKEKRNKDE